MQVNIRKSMRKRVMRDERDSEMDNARQLCGFELGTIRRNSIVSFLERVTGSLSKRIPDQTEMHLLFF